MGDRKNRQRSALPLALVLCALSLLALGAYLWTFDYNPSPLQPQPETTLRTPHPLAAARGQVELTLRIETDSFDPRPAPGVQKQFGAELRLLNNNSFPIRVLDAPLDSGLFEIRLTNPHGQPVPPVQRAQNPPRRPLLQTEPPLAPAPYRVTELLPGRALSIPCPLYPAYALTLPGRYTLTARYLPAAYAHALGLDLQDLGLAGGASQTPPLSFTVKTPARPNGPQIADRSAPAQQPPPHPQTEPAPQPADQPGP